MRNRGNLSLVQLAAMKKADIEDSDIDSTLLGTDGFKAAMIVGHLNRKEGTATAYLTSQRLTRQRGEYLIKCALHLDGSKLRLIPSMKSNREAVEIAVSPGPFDDIIYSKRVDKRRCTYLKHADLSVFEYDCGVREFMRKLMRLGCRKADFPDTVWDAFWEGMPPEEQAAFAASVLLHPQRRQ